MKSLNDMTLNERIKFYAEGDKQHKIQAHSFDFTRQDAENIMSALRIVWLLSREDYPHDWQYERPDLVSYIRTTSAILKIAKRFVEKCPLTTLFRIERIEKDKNITIVFNEHTKIETGDNKEMEE